MLAEEFSVFAERPEQTVEVHLRQHRHQGQHGTGFQGHAGLPVQDCQRPCQEYQQHPTIQAHSSSQGELRQADPHLCVWIGGKELLNRFQEAATALNEGER